MSRYPSCSLALSRLLYSLQQFVMGLVEGEALNRARPA